MMTQQFAPAKTLTNLDVQVDYDEVAQKIQTGRAQPSLHETANQILEKLGNVWSPAIVYKWLHCRKNKDAENSYVLHNSTGRAQLNLGYSSQFLDNAKYVLTAAYTAGSELDDASRKATEDKLFLAAYLIDIIGLIVLEKTCDVVKQIAEQKAKDMGWGVSPFLSPGSVHGWELEEQLKLCRLLPLKEVGINIESNSVLHPFKSLTCIIGIGPDYPSQSVGSTCQLCSKKDDCQLKHVS